MALISVITVIQDSAGTPVDLGTVERLQFGEGITVTRSTALGPPTLIVSITAAPVTRLPACGNVQDAALDATSSGQVILVFASMEAPTYIGTLYVCGLDALTADATNYRTLTIYDQNDDGTQNGSALWVGTTKPSGTNASGNWLGLGKVVWEIVIGQEIAAGHRLIALWGKAGTGVVRPAIAWRIT